MPINFDKLDDYFLWFDALVPGAIGVGLLLVGNVDTGIAILVACAILPALDHIRANVTDDSPNKRIRSWLFLITSTGMMALLIAGGVSLSNPLSWVGVVIIYAAVWFVVVQFRKTLGKDLDPYDRMYLASGHVFGILVPTIAYVFAAMMSARSLLRIGSPAIPVFFLVFGWLETLLLVFVLKAEIISKQLLTFDPADIQQRKPPRRFIRALQDRFSYLILSMLGMTVDSSIRTKGAGLSFLVAFVTFAALVVTVPDVGILGWDFIAAQLLVAILALVGNLVFFVKLTPERKMDSGWMPRF